MWLDDRVTTRSEKTRDEIPGSTIRVHFLETRMYVGVAKVTELCKAHFGPDFQYDDGVARKDGFTAKYEYVANQMPYLKRWTRRPVASCTTLSSAMSSPSPSS